jgi:DNA-binding transcriptional ArsR family regulator
MDVDLDADDAASGIAAAIGEPARARMLYRLMDGCARTSTELAIVADVSPSTASVHLNRLKEQNLVKVFAQGRHRYYSLRGPEVARVLEGLSVLAGAHSKFVPRTPERLHAARTCYDHVAGTLGVTIHDRIKELGWLRDATNGYEVTLTGARAIESLGVDLEGARLLRRRFAYPCLDWSERRPHLGGALGANLFRLFLSKNWLTQDLDSRALALTRAGRRELLLHLGLQI